MKHISSQEELAAVRELLKIEQTEDRLQYEQNVLRKSIPERRAAGVSWYPVAIRDTFYGTGERLMLEIERPSFTDIAHTFQFGAVASLFSNADPDEDYKISGVVTAVRKNNLRLTLFVDELPEWVDKGKLGLDLLFDESSYKEMDEALSRVMKARNNRLTQLREVLLGFHEAKFGKHEPVVNEKLNASQNEALNNILKAEDVAIIHGPPGTGKTTTLVRTVIEVLKEENQVLVCAPSNAAVDLLSEKFTAEGLRVLRIGHPSRISDSLLQLSLDQQVIDHPEYKLIRELKKRAAEYKNMASKYKRHFGREERQQRKMIMDEARKLQTEAEGIEKYITTDLVEKAQVITCTLVGSANYVLQGKIFHTVFIDEAAQALEPACWIPIEKAQRVVFAGDHCQLPPTIKSYDAAKGGLSHTLFEKTIHRQKNAAVMLKTQYRMNEDIMKFSSDYFYHSGLEAHTSVAKHVFENYAPLEFIDTAGCGFQEQEEKESRSTFNPEEATLLLKRLNEHLTSGSKPTVAVITPYKAQMNFIREELSKYEALASYPFLSVNTVDAFQGQERDLVFISLVRSNDSSEIGFLSDYRRMNVAMTRARKRLVIIGDSATLGESPFYKSFIDYAESKGYYRSAWEWLG